MFTLKNFNTLITGGTKGIGKATVELFVELGANVIFTARNQTEIETVTEALQIKYPTVTGIQADVTKAEDIQKIKTEIEKTWGKLDVLINNAGTNIRKATIAFSDEDYQFVLDTNIKAPFRISKALYRFCKNPRIRP